MLKWMGSQEHAELSMSWLLMTWWHKATQSHSHTWMILTTITLQCSSALGDMGRFNITCLGITLSIHSSIHIHFRFRCGPPHSMGLAAPGYVKHQLSKHHCDEMILQSYLWTQWDLLCWYESVNNGCVSLITYPHMVSNVFIHTTLQTECIWIHCLLREDM